MIELTVLTYLTSKLSVPVYMEIPERMPEKFVVIEKASSQIKNKIKNTSFICQSYADSLEDACKLNDELNAALQDIVELNEIGGSHPDGGYNFTDTDLKKYRYQLTCDINY